MSTQEDVAATKMQSAMRGRRARAQVAEQKKAATAITRVAKGRAARKAVAEKKKQADDAAVAVQRIAKGRAARKSVSNRRSAAGGGAVHPAAKKLVDGIISDLEMEAVDPSAKALVDGILADLERRELSKAFATAAVEDARRKSTQLKPTPPATKSTSASRGKRASAPERRAAAGLDENQAAIKVQAAARGRIVRKNRGARRSNASAAPALGREENQAAIKVQSVARGRWARKRVDEMKKGDLPSRIPGPKSLGPVKTPTSPLETEPSDRSSTELEPLVPRMARAPAGSKDTKKPSARRRPQPGKSPRLTTHALNPISGDSATPSSGSDRKSSRGSGHSLEMKGYLQQIEALQAKVAKLEEEKGAAYRLLDQHGIKQPSASTGTDVPVDGIIVGNRRGSTGTALVNVERELETLRQQNAELRKALKDRDSAPKGRKNSSESGNRRRSTRMSS